MKPGSVAITFPAQSLKALREIFNDALYRGSLFLLANTVATSAIGFVFWTLAAHRYPASAVGVFSGITSGVTLLAAIAAVGLPVTMTRHIARAEEPRGLVLMAITVIATAGTMLCLAAVLFLGPRLPPALHIQQRGGMAFLVTVLVVFTAMGGTFDAGLVAIRSTRFVLIKNLIGSAVKLVAMLLLATFWSSGLLISLALGLVSATVLSGAALGRRIKRRRSEATVFHMPWHYLSITSGNYVATVIGILPLSVVPIEVLAMRGPTQTARFSIAFLIAGFLNFIPSTTGQVLFAELARGEASLGRQFHKALRGVYGLLLPAMLLLLAAAPFVLSLFGRAYAADATGCLRLLALSALPAGGTYLIDSLLIARDRTAAYTFMQIANAALMLGCVGILLPRGITGAAGGIAIAQVLTLVLGLLVLATGKLGRHHPKAGIASSGRVVQHPPHEHQPSRPVRAFDPQIRELLAAWPTMPTTLIAERIGWVQSPRVLLDRVTELRSAYALADLDARPSRYRIGDMAQCGIWFPPADVPVGSGQTRFARQLPVLTMITGYSHWLSAILIPSSRPEDLFAGWWKLIAELGAVPRMLSAQSDRSIGWRVNGRTQITPECIDFCRSLGTEVAIGETGEAATTSLPERAYIRLEDSFLRGRAFNSPQDFNVQLRHWLATENSRPRPSSRYSPGALMAAERKAMLPLPYVLPRTGWRYFTQVGNYPFLRFDRNQYSVPLALLGRTVKLAADLDHIRILYDGKVAAHHDRAWTCGQTIRDPAHGIAPNKAAKSFRHAERGG